MTSKHKIDPNRLKVFRALRAKRLMFRSIISAVIIILIDASLGFMGVYIVGIGFLILFLSMSLMIRYSRNKLSWQEMVIEIDLEHGILARHGPGILESRFEIASAGNVYFDKDGIKLYSKGAPSFLSKINRSSNLNQRHTNFYIPMVITEYEEIKERISEKLAVSS